MSDLDAGHWQKISPLLDEALALGPDERQDWLGSLKANSPELAASVQEFLEERDALAAENFLEHTPVSFEDGSIGGILGQRSTALAPGTRIDTYEVISLLGAGGMGEVYRAKDASLKRIVAIKLLPSYVARDPDRLRRFEQEAQAAATLNHPNIVTVFQFGTFQGTPFMVTEFLDGVTLRELLKRGTLPVHAAIDYGVQIADALASAHGRGIIHRDLKPENLFITADGRVKVLDFGLAKLRHPDSEQQQAALTEPGKVMGTVAYMSPEQARGEELDPRTDIFSLGAVLYEMATGKMAFPGKTAAVVHKAILNDLPPRPSEIAPSLPRAFDHVAEKALEKDRDLRYQSAVDLKADLKRLQRDSDSQRFNATALEATLSGSPLKRRAIIAAAVSLAVMAGIAAVVYRWVWTMHPPYLDLQKMTIKRLTDNGKIQALALSPDARFIAYSLQDPQQGLWVQQVSPESKVQVVPASVDLITDISFSPDGNYLYFARNDKGYVVPALGGTPKLIIKFTFGGIGVSSDGRKLAYVHGGGSAKSELIVVNRDGTREHVIADHPPGSEISFNSASAPSWSPDGTLIAMPALRNSDWVLNIYPSEGGSPQAILLPGQIWQAVWLRDQSGILVLSASSDTSQPQIWLQPFPRGTLQRMTNDLDGYSALSTSSDGKLLAAVQIQRTFTTFVGPASKPEHGAILTAGKSDGIGLGWMPDGNLLSQNVDSEFSLLSPDGKQRTPLFKEEVYRGCFSVCKDGRYIVLGKSGSGRHQFTLGRIDASGTNLKQLTVGPEDVAPDCSPDGQSVIYWSASDFTFRRISIDGGATFAFAGNGLAGPKYSPNGREIAGLDFDEKKLIVRDSHTGNATKSFELPSGYGFPFNSAGWSLRWTPDGRALTYALWKSAGAAVNLWSQPLSGGAPIQITHFPDAIAAYDWSPDGKQLALTRRSQSQDVVLISNFR